MDKSQENQQQKYVKNPIESFYELNNIVKKIESGELKPYTPKYIEIIDTDTINFLLKNWHLYVNKDYPGFLYNDYSSSGMLQRPNNYDDDEWLSHIYYVSNDYNSVIQIRRAPDSFLNSARVLIKNKSQNIIELHDYYTWILENSDPIMKMIINENINNQNSTVGIVTNGIITNGGKFYRYCMYL